MTSDTPSRLRFQSYDTSSEEYVTKYSVLNKIGEINRVDSFLGELEPSLLSRRTRKVDHAPPHPPIEYLLNVQSMSRVSILI